MHLPAPRSCSGHNSSNSASWTQSFVPGRTIGARKRWFLVIGTLIAGALFPVGFISNAANNTQDAPRVATLNKVDAEKSPQQSQKVEQTPESDKTAETKSNNLDGQNSSEKTADSQQSSSSAVTTAEETASNTTPAVTTAPSTPPISSSADSTAVSAPASSTQPSQVTLRVIVDGQSRSVQAPANLPLGRALAEGGIVLQKLDRVQPDVKTTAYNGLKVRIETVRTKLETRTEALAPDFRIKLTQKLAPGREQLAEKGKPGTATITESVVYVGGKRVRKAFVSRMVTTPAQDKILAVGTHPRFLPHAVPYHKRYARAYQSERSLSARGGSPRSRMAMQAAVEAAPTPSSDGTWRPVKCMIMVATGYSPNEGPIGGGPRTATGLRVTRGAIATDPRVIPLGTKLYVEGYGYGFACDTGGAIKGNHIDLAFDSARECNAQGRTKRKVWILSK